MGPLSNHIQNQSPSLNPTTPSLTSTLPPSCIVTQSLGVKYRIPFIILSIKYVHKKNKDLSKKDTSVVLYEVKEKRVYS